MVKGKLHTKNEFHMLGFGLVGGVVKVFPVSSLSLARNQPGKNGHDVPR